MRTLSKSFAALLITAALFWGNCFSCPQLLLSLSAKAPHGCCKRSAPVSRTCYTRSLKNFVKADPVAPAASAAGTVVAVTVIPPPAPREFPAVSETPHFPPDILQSISILRV